MASKSSSSGNPHRQQFGVFSTQSVGWLHAFAWGPHAPAAPPVEPALPPVAPPLPPVAPPLPPLAPPVLDAPVPPALEPPVPSDVELPPQPIAKTNANEDAAAQCFMLPKSAIGMPRGIQLRSAVTLASSGWRSLCQ
jgi:hypothetical protein